jgi:hypothetical protein
MLISSCSQLLPPEHMGSRSTVDAASAQAPRSLPHHAEGNRNPERVSDHDEEQLVTAKHRVGGHKPGADHEAHVRPFRHPPSMEELPHGRFEIE